MASDPKASKEVFLNNVALSAEDAAGCLDLDAEKVRLEKIWTAAHMSIKDMVKAVGLSKTAFAKEVGIPFRTIQNWSLEERTPPAYIRFLLAEHYKLI